MALWEYKVITSGKGGFASPAHLEKFLNELGRDEWEIIEFRTPPDNPLAFAGLARRSTQRDWTLEDAAAAAARTEADKLRAEFEAKFRGMPASGAAAADGGEEALSAESSKHDELRHLRDTERDQDPDAPDEEPKDEWDLLTAGEALPTFFEAIRPHMRRNQRGPGMSVGVDYLVKKWDLSEDDIKGALVDCGFTVPEDEDTKPDYLEFDGDLYWVNLNRRGELWINTKEKPRPVFRVVKGERVAPEEAESAPSAEDGGSTEKGGQGAEKGGRKRGDRKGRKGGDSTPKEEGPPEPLPTGPELLSKLYPLMRRNRRGSGRSGSVSFLSRALRCEESELTAALNSLGLAEPPADGPAPDPIEIDSGSWALDRDKRGGIWINGRLKADEGFGSSEGSEQGGEPGQAPASAGAEKTDSVGANADGDLLASVRSHLQEGKAGTFSAEISGLAQTLGREEPDLVALLSERGLKVPEKAREKPVYVEFGGENFWFNRNSKGEIWVNAKASSLSHEDSDAEDKPRRSRSKKQSEAEGEEPKADSDAPESEA